MVEDVAVFRRGARLTTAHAHGADGMIADGPVGHVEVVDVLFDDVVAGEPGEVEPVTDLPFGVGHAVGPGFVPESPLVPVDPSRDDLAKRAVVDLFHRGEVVVLVTTLGASDDAQLLLLGRLVGRQDPADARAVHPDRLFGEEVLARGDHRFDMNGAKTGRSGQQHEIDVRLDHLLVGVQADELAVADIHLVALLGQVGQAGVDPIGEGVAHRDQLNARGGTQAVVRRARAAPAAADEAHLEGVGSGGMDQRGQRQRRGGSR